MRNFILYFSLLTMIPSLSPAEQPTLSSEDKYIVAANQDISILQGQGRYSCTYAQLVNIYGKDSEHKSYGKSINEAQQRLALLCVKERCQHLGEQIVGYLNETDSYSESDTYEYYKAKGYTDSEISAYLKEKKDSRSNLNNITCETAPPSSRFLIVHSCISSPMLCGE